VLGDVLARVSGSSFENYLREQVLLPAGMPHSSFLLAELPPGLLGWPHLRSPEMKVNPAYPYHRADAPASFLHTTVVDLCHWAIASLQRGSFAGQSFLSPAAYDQMWTPAASRGNPPGMYEEMGLGWTLGHFKGFRTVSHGGAGFGWASFLLLLPELDSAAVVFCNEESSACRQAVRAAADALTGQAPQAGPVSWMVAVSRALAEGGMQAASACYAMLKESGSPEVNFDEYDLDNLGLQLLMAGQTDLAIGVLRLNIQVFPAHIDSYLLLARLFLRKGEIAQARGALAQVLSIDPANAAASFLHTSIADLCH
jgi:tetratricopeptide (TPR) repeat protein